MPPPASTTQNTFGQWSRPAVVVDLRRAAELDGHHHERRVEQPALVEVADQRARTPGRTSASAPFDRALRCCRDGPSRRTSATRTARRLRRAGAPSASACPASFRPYSSFSASGSAFEVERLARLLRAERARRRAGRSESIASSASDFSSVPEMVVDRSSIVCGASNRSGVMPPGSSRSRTWKFCVRRIAPEAERPKRRAKIAGARELIRHDSARRRTAAGCSRRRTHARSPSPNDGILTAPGSAGSR